MRGGLRVCAAVLPGGLVDARHPSPGPHHSVVRAEIVRSPEISGVLAQRYGVFMETVRKWRQRGPDACQDRSARPHKLPWKATEEERAIVCALRQATGFPLGDLTFVGL